MKQDFILDQIDRKILKILQRDATVSNADLAEMVGASSASCWRRVKAMESAGVLIGNVRLADPNKLRCGVTVLCYIRVANQLYASSKAFETFVKDLPEVVECYSVSGDWDYLLRIVAADVANYNTFLMTTLLKHHAVASASSYFALERIKYTTELPVG